MHIRITFSSSYCNYYIYSSDNPKYYYIFDRTFKDDHIDINIKMKEFIKLVQT